MADPDLTLAILREIRSSVDKHRAETNARFDAHDARFDAQETINQQTTEALNGILQALLDAGRQQREMNRSLSAMTSIRRRADVTLADHEIRIAQLEDERDKAKG